MGSCAKLCSYGIWVALNSKSLNLNSVYLRMDRCYICRLRVGTNWTQLIHSLWQAVICPLEQWRTATLSCLSCSCWAPLLGCWYLSSIQWISHRRSALVCPASSDHASGSKVRALQLFPPSLLMQCPANFSLLVLIFSEILGRLPYNCSLVRSWFQWMLIALRSILV